MNDDDTLRLVGLGEALFDCFEDREVLGGAPLNSAAIMHQVGRRHRCSGVVASRIGNDPLGERLIGELRRREMTDALVQRDPQRPTGRVHVTLRDGEPSYEIVREAAWDYLEWTDALEQLAQQCRGVSFGTLGQRSPPSRAAIQRFLETATAAVRLFDVNLRPPFCDAEVIRRSCELCDVLKLNTEELHKVARMLGLDAEEAALPEAIRERFDLRAVVLTHGARGTELLVGGQRYTAEVPRYERAPGADPVGAGDACGAVCLIGLVLDWPPPRIVAAANRVAGFVANQQGATPTLPEAVLSAV
jgi:fructokinase